MRRAAFQIWWTIVGLTIIIVPIRFLEPFINWATRILALPIPTGHGIGLFLESLLMFIPVALIGGLALAVVGAAVFGVNRLGWWIHTKIWKWRTRKAIHVEKL